MLGPNDIAKSTRARLTPGRPALVSWLSAGVLAARVHDIEIIDGIYNDFNDDDGLRREAEQGRDIGLDGKMLIHPGQIATVNEIFAPSPEEIDFARKIIEIFDEPENADERRRADRRPHGRAPASRHRPPHAGADGSCGLIAPPASGKLFCRQAASFISPLAGAKKQGRRVWRRLEAKRRTRRSKVGGPNEAASAAGGVGSGAMPAAGPPRRRRAAASCRSSFCSALILLLVRARDRGLRGADLPRLGSERVGLAASYVESGLVRSAKRPWTGADDARGLTGETPAPVERQGDDAPQRAARRRRRPTLPPPAAERPRSSETPAAPTPAPAEAAEGALEPRAPRFPNRSASPPNVRSEPARDAQALGSRAGGPRPRDGRPGHRRRKIRRRRPACASAPAAAAAGYGPPSAGAEAVDADGFTDRDLISALEGRIEAMSDEVKTLREKLDAPKNETRAAPETEAPKSVAPAPVADRDGAPAAVVVAFALQRELEAGRPFAEEIAALSRSRRRARAGGGPDRDLREGRAHRPAAARNVHAASPGA